MTATEPSGYTTHGYWYGADEPDPPFPMVMAKCGGPKLCRQCAREAGHPIPPFRRETDLRREGTAGPVTDEDVLHLQRLANPEQNRLEQAIRADERRIVAEEIAQAIEAAALGIERGAFMPSLVQPLVGVMRADAAVAREFATKGAGQ